jgi:hypothetical protein
MVEDIASTLYALVQPTRSILLLVQWYCEGLTTAIVDGIDHGNVKFVLVFSKVVRTRHAYHLFISMLACIHAKLDRAYQQLQLPQRALFSSCHHQMSFHYLLPFWAEVDLTAKTYKQQML